MAAPLALTASLVATVVGARFCFVLARRWVAGGRRRPALLHWAVSTGMFALASSMLLLGELAGWTSVTFRMFYAFGAVLNVPWLALGSVLVNLGNRAVTRTVAVAALLVGASFLPAALSGQELAWAGAVLGLAWGLVLVVPRPKLVERASIALLVAFGVVGVVAVATAGLQGPLPAQGIPEGRELLVARVRGLAVGGNALGAVVVVVGAVASAVAQPWQHTTDAARRTFRRGLRSAPVEAVARMLHEGNRAARAAGVSHLAAGNLLIALGVLVAAGSGGMFSFLGDTTGHAVGLGGGVAIMYAGFTRTLRVPDPAVGSVAPSSLASSEGPSTSEVTAP